MMSPSKAYSSAALKMDEKHRYTVDGRVIPSVTKIIYAVLAIDEKYKRLRDEGILIDPEPYAKFGTAVHKAGELYVKKTLDREEMDPLLEPSLTAFTQFIEDTGFKVLESETMTYSKKFWYAIGSIVIPLIVIWINGNFSELRAQRLKPLMNY